MRLRNLGRIAIWNRAKIISAISMTIWLAYIAVFVYGKYLLQITVNCLYVWRHHRYNTGDFLFFFNLTALDLLALPDKP
jgi:hypothetical protein